ncbi:glycoside hydrolase family 2 protein [Paenibacillus sp. FSL H8-0259]|uniref:glycoside hydrolase family 2 protein n=1 Tax=Paenibacillus sp. FSL H8-0259 TaxID=1920423 RepID=UPI00096FEB00|nr:glycoside hydrolase family 2 [Paenibacillus sp. FSL H8-0259]OMF33068.1 hypothetical protein BK132_02230 [Paenibacillus sp. FSL H8-0259]
MGILINEGRYTARLEEGWKFQPGPVTRGEQEGWQASGLPSPVTVSVPHTWNVQEGLEEYRGAGWYEQMLTVPDEWKDCRIRLSFEGAYRDTDIWVNGVEAGSHYNSGYTPFEADLTPYIHAGGGNRLVIRVDNSNSDVALPQGNSFDWADDGGLIRPVTLVVTGLASIQQLKEVDLWHFDHPDLYELEIVLRTGDQVQDRVVRPFGFREIVVKGHELWLNREPVRLMGVEWMPGSNPAAGMAEKQADLIAMLERLKEANCVITRFHWQQGNDLLDWCDRNGLLVQEEIPHWQQPAEPGKETFALALSQAREMIGSHAHHPCIFAWGMGNELDGQSAVTLHYMEQLKAELLQLDPSRLINYVSNSVLYQPDRDATGAGDLLMWNEYIGTWHGDLDEHKVIRQIIADYPDKPIVVAEYGLCEPVFEGGDARRTGLLIEKTEIYRQYPQFAALIFFSLNDYRTQMGEEGEGKLKQRIHGSVDIYNRVKPSFAALREISSPLLLVELPVWHDGALEVTLTCRKDIPSYAVRDYYLTVSSAGEEGTRLVIPDMQPGDLLTLNLPVQPAPGQQQVLTVYRPNGFSVVERELN